MSHKTFYMDLNLVDENIMKQNLGLISDIKHSLGVNMKSYQILLSAGVTNPDHRKHSILDRIFSPEICVSFL